MAQTLRPLKLRMVTYYYHRHGEIPKCVSCSRVLEPGEFVISLNRPSGARYRCESCEKRSRIEVR